MQIPSAGHSVEATVDCTETVPRHIQRLCNDLIHEASSQLAVAIDQFVVLWSDHDTGKLADVLGQSAVGRPISLEHLSFILLPGAQDLFLLSGSLEDATGHELLLPFSYQGLFGGGKIALAHAQEVDPIEQTGLPHSIQAEYPIDLGRKSANSDCPWFL